MVREAGDFKFVAERGSPVIASALWAGRAAPGWERIVWHSIHLIFVGAFVLTVIVVFALVCRWFLRQERRRRRGGGPLQLSPTGYPLGRPATGGG